MPKAFPLEFRRDVVAVARKGQAPLSQVAVAVLDRGYLAGLVGDLGTGGVNGVVVGEMGVVLVQSGVQGCQSPGGCSQPASACHVGDGTTTAWNKDRTKVLYSHGPPAAPGNHPRMLACTLRAAKRRYRICIATVSRGPAAT
jgi:hypothetical protein